MINQQSKTPNFDENLNEILDNLKPHQRTCQQCGEVFNIFQEDIEFYKKLRVPPPTLCLDCRMQRRLGWRINFLPIFYKKTCSAPGHQEKIISFYSEENPVKVYDDEYYLSDNWDALEFGKDYDFNKPFFEQFNQLALEVPHESLQKDPKGINCDYVVAGVSSKNCYYVAVPYYSENIYYASLPSHSKDCLDVNQADFSEQCYESVYIDRCYNCNFCYECSNCLDSYFLYDCRNCQNCFGGTNLRNKKYYFFNQPLTKEEYQKKIKEINPVRKNGLSNGVNLGKRSVLREYQTKFEKLLSQAIRKNLNNIKTVNSLGNDLKGCRNCFYAFRVLSESENLRYGAYVDHSNDLMDFFGHTQASLIYESTAASFGNNIKFSFRSRNSLELEYCIECDNCQYCFGCFGLRSKKFCIFNKQYNEDEYWQKVDKIKTEMLKRGEYGEFFPLKYSPFPYQDSNASIEFPLTKEEIIKNGWHWQDEIKSEIDLSKLKVLKTDEVPDDIKDVSDDILDAAIICEQTQKPFRITKFELDFYRKKNLPIPAIHPFQRVKNRFAFHHPFKLWQYPCSKCGQVMYSGWDPEKKFKVYCEKCYLREVV
jgi:hypothetical protein